MNRWNPWAAPLGTRPENAVPGGLGPVAVAHLGAVLVIVNAAAALASLAHPHRVAAGVLYVAGAVALTAAAERLARATKPVLTTLWGLVAAGACAYLAQGVGVFAAAGGASTASATFAGAAVLLASAAILHARRASMGTLIVASVGLIVAPLALIGTDSGQPRQVYAAALVLASVVFAAALTLGRVRPASVLVTGSVLTGVSGAGVLLEGHTPAVAQLTVAVLVLALAWLTAEAGVPLAAMLLLLGGAVDVTLLARAWHGFAWPGAGAAVVGSIVVLGLADLDRRTAVRPRLGGTVLVGTLLALGGSLFLLAVPTGGANVVGGLCLVALGVAGVVMGRRLVVAAAVIAFALAVPARITSQGSLGHGGEEALFAVIGLGLLALVARARPRPPAVLPALARGDLSGAPVPLGSVATPYPAVFDALLATLARSHIVHHADRAAGRIATNEVALLLWQERDGRTRLVSVGAPDDILGLLSAAGLGPLTPSDRVG